MHEASSGGRALQAVLWDMDGTLVDTEPSWIRAETELLADYGRTWTAAEAETLIGSALPDTARTLRAAGVDLSAEQIIDRLVGAVVRQVREAIPWRPGARELLADLASAGVPCALVTMSEGRLTREIVQHLPTGTFRVCVTGEMVTAGKPAPDPYLLAVTMLAESLGETTIAAHRCVALEDSVPGVTSALAAGAVTIGIPNQTPLPSLPGLVQWESLAGRTAADLEAVVAGLRPARPS